MSPHLFMCDRRPYKRPTDHPFPEIELLRKPEFANVSRQVCKVEGCDRELPWNSRNSLCMGHAARLRRHGSFLEHKPLRPYGTRYICSVEGCGRKAYIRDDGSVLCRAHRLRFVRMGDVNADIPIRGYDPDGFKECAVPDCHRHVIGKGYCRAHYVRLKTHGDVYAKSKIRKWVRKK